MEKRRVAPWTLEWFSAMSTLVPHLSSQSGCPNCPLKWSCQTTDWASSRAGGCLSYLTAGKTHQLSKRMKVLALWLLFMHIDFPGSTSNACFILFCCLFISILLILVGVMRVIKRCYSLISGAVKSFKAGSLRGCVSYNTAVELMPHEARMSFFIQPIYCDFDKLKQRCSHTVHGRISARAFFMRNLSRINHDGKYSGNSLVSLLLPYRDLSFLM